jgi:hypothetical protein
MMTRAIAVLAVSSSIVVMASASCLAQPAAAGCEPAWARACASTTRGTAPVEGVVQLARGFSASSVAVMYRTTEGSLGPRAGMAEYGPWRAAQVGSNGGFNLLLPACAAQARSTGCIGGAYELYAAYGGRPCTEMWYASLIAEESDYLPENAFSCGRTSNNLAPLTKGNFEPWCQPSWARNCMPGTAGVTSVSGVIERPSVYTGPFSLRDVSIAYRTREASLSGQSVYGETHYVRVLRRGQFSLTLRGCSLTMSTLGGCAGGAIEAWPAYERFQCGETPSRLMVAGESQKWGKIICDTRGELKGTLRATNAEAWKVTASGTHVYTVPVEAGGKFSLLLPRGAYRVTARNGRKQCAKSYRVKIKLAQKTNLIVHC